MFHKGLEKGLAFFLSVCMLLGGVSETAYAGTPESGVEQMADAAITADTAGTALTEEDGVYSATFGDYTFRFKPVAGYQTIRLENVSVTGDEPVSGTYEADFEAISYLENGSSAADSCSVMLESENRYCVSKDISGLSMQTEHFLTVKLYHTAQNTSSKEEVLTITEPFVVKTLASDRSVEIVSEDVTWQSVSFAYEILEGDKTFYSISYAPENASGDEILYPGLFIDQNGVVSVSHLLPDTDYVFSFRYNGFALQKFHIRTKSFPGEVTYTVTDMPNSSDKKIDCRARGLGSLAEGSFQCYCVYTDVYGKERQDSYYLQDKDGDGVYTTEYPLTTSFILAGENTPIDLWIGPDKSMWIGGEVVYTGYVKYAEERKTVDTRISGVAAENITLGFEQDNTNPTTMHITATVTGGTAGEYVGEVLPGFSCWRKDDELREIKDWNRPSAYDKPLQYEVPCTFPIENLELGQTYGCVFRLGGVAKTGEFRVGEPMYAIRTTDDTDAFDSILTYQLSVSDGDVTDGDLSVMLLYQRSDSDAGYVALTEKMSLNNGKVTVKTGDYTLLDPNHRYRFRWSLYQGNSAEPVFNSYQTIETKAVKLKEEEVSASSTEIRRKLTITNRTEYLSAADSITFAVYGRQDPDKTYCRIRGFANTNREISFKKEDNFSAELRVDGLLPDTKYIFSLRRIFNSIEEGTLVQARTAVDGRQVSIDSKNVGLYTIELQGSVSGTPGAGSINKVFWIFREKGTKSWNYSWVEVDESGKFEITMGKNTLYEVKPLKPDTTYEYMVGFPWYDGYIKSRLINPASGEIKTLQDGRDFTYSVKPGKTSAEIEISVTGDAIDEDNEGTSVYFYYRKKGLNEEWNQSWCSFLPQRPKTQTMKIPQFHGALEPDTAYEYVIGIGVNNTPVDELLQRKTGEFVTVGSARRIEQDSVKISVGFTSAVISGEMKGNEPGESAYLYLFYRRKAANGSQAGDWATAAKYTYNGSASYNRYIYTSVTDLSFSGYISNLEPGTAYEYAMCADSKWDVTGPDAVPAGPKAEGTFETKANPFAVELRADETGLTANSAEVSVTLKSSAQSTSDENVRVELYLAGAREGAAVDSKMLSVRLTKVGGYQGKVSFTRLLGDTQYKVEKAILYVTENESECRLAELPQTLTFQTKKPVVPEEITLAKDEIFLNLSACDEYYDIKDFGSGYDQIKATLKPQTAAADLVYTSGDTQVATVTRDGYVYPVGTGECEITVASVYDATVKATCKVTVKDYVVGRKESENVFQTYRYSEGSYVSIARGETLSGMKLYENKNGELTELSDVAWENMRPSIAAISEDGTLQANGRGDTMIYAVCNGVKTPLKTEVYIKNLSYGIVGIRSNDTRYPAVKNGEDTYIVAQKSGVYYTVMGAVSPAGTFDANDFTWTSSDASVAEISGSLRIDAKKPGKTTITVTPKVKENYLNQEARFQLEVRAAIPESGASVQVLTNYKNNMALDDIRDYVSAPAVWGGTWNNWRFANPNASLYTLPTGTYRHTFDVEYDGTAYYPGGGKLEVALGTLTAASVSEVNGAHGNVLLAGGQDSMTLRVNVDGYGSLAGYKTELKLKKGTADGVAITEDAASGTWRITASKTGAYTVEPVVFWTDAQSARHEIKLKTATYSFKATNTEPVADIVLSAVYKDGTVLSVTSGSIAFDIDDKKDFTMTATAKNRAGQDTAASFEWKVTDSGVAKITVKSGASNTADIAVKGEGHAVISVKAKDDAGYTVRIPLEVRNHRPRVNIKKADANMALDYDTSEGRYLATQLASGPVEVAEVYGEEIRSIELYNAAGYNDEKHTGDKSSKCKLRLFDQEGAIKKYVVEPTGSQTGSCQCKLRIETAAGVYSYPLDVTIADKKPTVTWKTIKKLNLFYILDKGTMAVKVSGGKGKPVLGTNSGVERVTWEDDEKVGDGFEFAPYSNSKDGRLFSISQTKVRTTQDRKLTYPDVAKGTLSVKLLGYSKEVTLSNVKIEYQYKKPTIKAVGSTINVMPEAGVDTARFYLYDKLSKYYLYCGTSGNTAYDYYYDAIAVNGTGADVSAYGSNVYLTYKGSKKESKYNLTMTSANWRESLKTRVTVKSVAPKASLYMSQVTLNSACKNVVNNSIWLQNGSTYNTIADVEIRGKNTPAQDILKDDRLEIGYSDNTLCITMNDPRVTGKTVKAGTYSYELTPYYINRTSGEKTALNKLTLKVRVTDQKPSARVTAKGTLDLTNDFSYSSYSSYWGYSSNPAFVTLTAKFSGVEESGVCSYRLLGEYSEYFSLAAYGTTSKGYENRLWIRDRGKLKAGKTYKLQIEYTMENRGTGERFTVKSNVFNVKPKQTAPKVTIEKNGQTLYAASSMSRGSYLSVPYGYCVESASGSVDCNKDGNPDITVWSSGSYLYVQIIDRDAVTATAAGKSYTIPVTVCFRGRDGISKDSTVSLKVKVKR